MLRLNVVVSLLSFVFPLVAVSASNAQSADWSRALFAETQYDYRGIPRGTLARHSFRFVNNSNADIRLVGARSSCGCTRVYAPTNKVYRPGESGEIVAEIDAVRYTGVRHATVTAVFDRPQRVEISLDVRGVVVENVRLEPTSLHFVVDETISAPENDESLEISKNNPRIQQATVLYPSFSETVAKIESSNPYLSVEIGRPVRTNSGLQTPLTIKLASDAPAGYFNDVVYLWSNGARSATPLSLTVEGVVRPQISVAPPTLSFSASADGKKIVKNVVVAGAKAFTIKSVESTSPALECDFDAAAKIAPDAPEARSVYVIPVAFDPTKLDAVSATTALTIETNDGQVLRLQALLSAENFAGKRDPSAAPDAAVSSNAPNAANAAFRDAFQRSTVR